MITSRAFFFAVLASSGLFALGARGQPASAPAPAPPAPASPAGRAEAQPAPIDAPAPRSALEGLEPRAGGLTSDEVARRALRASASVGQKRAELEAAREKISQTTIQFFPRLTLQASYTRLSPVSTDFGSGALVGAQNAGPLSVGPCPGGGPGTCVLDSAGAPVGAASFAIQQLNNNYALTARLTIPLSDYLLRISDAAASSSAAREAAQLALEAEKLEVASGARSLYFALVRAEGQVVVAESAVGRTRARLEDARAAFSVGAMSKADLLRIEALVANTELLVTRSASLKGLTMAQLAILMEDHEAPIYQIGEGIPDPSRLAVERAPLKQLVAEALGRRLEIRAVEQSMRSLRRGADAVRAGALPRLDGFGDLTYANPNQRFFPPQEEWNATWSLGLSATWTVNDTFQSSAAARELDATAVGLEHRRRAVQAGIAQQVSVAYFDIGRARAALDTQVKALESAEESYRVTTDLFRAGRATSSDVIEAEGDLLDARLGDVNARIDLAVATLALRHATGRDIADGLRSGS